MSLPQELLDHLKAHAAGRAHAAPLADLAAFFGTNWRAVAKAIERLRTEGYPVGTSRSEPCGAYWPVTDDDFEAALRGYEAAWKRMASTISRLRHHVPGRVLERIEREAKPEQMGLFGGQRP